MIFISTSCVKKKLIGESIKELVEMGHNHIELSGGTEHYLGWNDDLLELREKYTLNYSVHNYFPPPENVFVLNPCSANEDNYRRSFALIKTAIEVSDEVGADVYGFHPGYIVEMNSEKKGIYFGYQKSTLVEKEAKEALFYERFDTLLAELSGMRVRIAVENLFPFNSEEDFSLLSCPQEIIRFLNRYSDNEKVGLLLDFGHLNVASYFLDFNKTDFIKELFEKYSHKVFEIHLSDNDGTGDHHLATTPSSWQISQLNRYKKVLSHALITIEWRPDGIRQQSQWLKEIQDILN